MTIANIWVFTILLKNQLLFSQEVLSDAVVIEGSNVVSHDGMWNAPVSRSEPTVKHPRIMYRLLLLSVFIHATLAFGGCGHGHRHGNGHHHHDQQPNFDGNFDGLSKGIVAVDQALQRNCSSNGNHLSETYWSNNYQLSVRLPEFAVQNIKVKRMHRVLFVEAIKADGKTFSEVKVLPEVVDPASAGWVFSNGRLVIDVNYRVALGKEFVQACNVVIDTTVFDVPMSN